ncbi:hypothetical protein Fleli_1335 [Bernardetia litoralis DSM 6794]|uniref:Uncharacterized protein n=1 Tax=Bernardetia litoralis (strain ATCC 23117 / DSM 6794 / NBRC 15988 / NCIMB 1366 / Fx l1 / Sio-4) TaxID=880071 RepID=I4AII2_BERLS|nr:hypothetical protein [Bernardetia litoralis]AFM03767.1 hypothetical protein Fleli_1335 [Bernardetia litoralis DSM 6794]
MNFLEKFTRPHHFTHQTSQQTEAIQTKLKNSLNITNEVLSRLSPNTQIQAYEGEVSEKGFIITRQDKRKYNTFPVAQGVIKETTDGSEVVGTITHTTTFKRIFSASLSLSIISILFVILSTLTSIGEKFISITLILGSCCFLIFLLYYFTSKSSIKNIKKHIIEVIERQEQ